MEYLIGIYILGWVFCSLYIVARVYVNPDILRNDKWWNVIGIGVFTCTIWPIFLAWVVRSQLEDLKRF